MSFTHLHLHTAYSLLDGAGRINEMVKRVKELGQEAVAITDHGVMYGVVEFFTTCIKNGIKPIIGSEVYVVEDSLHNKIPSEHRYHLILLCENNVGYNNLIKIVSTGFRDGYYYRPRVDYETLQKYHEGIICLTACLAGEVPVALLKGDYNDAVRRAENLRNIFGENNIFIEIQNHNLADEMRIQPDLIRLSKELNIPLVATNDVHYTYKEDSFAHDCLICLQTGKKITDSNRMSYEKEKFYITSEDEMNNLFSFCTEAVRNTEIIKDRCFVKFDFTKSQYNDLISAIDENAKKGIIDKNVDYFKNMIGEIEYRVPTFEIPNSLSNVEYLKKLVYEGIENRYKDKLNEDIKNRANYELEMIIKMGFVDYFLVVWDYINFAKTNNIPVGPGRGSAAGSLVSYALQITNVDPIKFNLFFERFLNPERVSMPDIDTDFCVDGRADVIEYVKRKYGKSQVAQIVSFNALASKQVLSDMGRVQGVPLPKVVQIKNLIATNVMLDEDGKRPDLYKMLNSNIEDFALADREKVLTFRDMYNEDAEMKLMVDTSLRIEGIPRNASVHASGVIIAPDDISNYVPFARGKENDKDIQNNNSDNSVLVTEYDMTTLEKMGLLKMDILGLRNVTIIKNCINLIKETNNVEIDINNINYEDENVFKMISMGDTLGIFQLESPGMTNFIKKLKPSRLEDLIAGISLFRPGPMDFIDKYISGKRNEKNIKYDTEKLKSILSPTYGCIVYQEQVMQIVQELAGFTLGRADEVRRAMSKKKSDVLNAERNNFIYGNSELNIKGCLANGVSESIGNKIFNELIQFAKYAFNKSHAAAYAVLAYQTAFLKYYYKKEFYTSICNSEIFNRDKLAKYVGSVILDNIKILPVNINKSIDAFSVEGNDIRMGFAAIKSVGENISKEIIEERNANGKYLSFVDAVKRISLRGGNKNSIEALIMCGAFDEFIGNRNQKLHAYPNIIENNQKNNKNSMPGEISIFDFMAEKGMDSNEYKLNDSDLLKEYENVNDFTDDEKLSTEKKYTGIYLSGHPLNTYIEIINKKTNCNSLDFLKDEQGERSLEDGKEICIVGIIDEIRKLRTKRNNEEMAIVTLSDLYGIFDVVLFPKKYEMFSNEVYENNKVLIKGKFSVDEVNDRGQVYVDEFINIQKFIENDSNALKGSKLKLYFNDADTFKLKYNNMISILKEYKGSDYVEIILRKEKMNKVMKEFPVIVSKEFLEKLYENFGEINVIVDNE